MTASAHQLLWDSLRTPSGLRLRLRWPCLVPRPPWPWWPCSVCQLLCLLRRPYGHAVPVRAVPVRAVPVPCPHGELLSVLQSTWKLLWKEPHSLKQQLRKVRLSASLLCACCASKGRHVQCVMLSTGNVGVHCAHGCTRHSVGGQQPHANKNSTARTTKQNTSQEDRWMFVCVHARVAMVAADRLCNSRAHSTPHTHLPCPCLIPSATCCCYTHHTPWRPWWAPRSPRVKARVHGVGWVAGWTAGSLCLVLTAPAEQTEAAGGCLPGWPGPGLRAPGLPPPEQA